MTEKLKLASVQHFRCGEPTFDRTLVWVPEAMTLDEFEAIVLSARNEYLAFARRFKDEEPPNEYRQHMPVPFGQYPDRTVREVQADWAAKKVVWEQWDADRQQARKTLGDYLSARGLKRFWEHDHEFAIECDWGHNHGITLNYDESKFTDASYKVRSYP